jgi:menaquinone-9 beta-reductase
MSCDLAIIGGGPAGCAAAIIAAASGARVVLLEQGRLPRHKVCGEFVSGESLDLLNRLLAPEWKELISTAPAIERARIFADNLKIEAVIEPAARSIGRLDLDFALWESCARSRVEVRQQCAVSSIEGSGPFHLAAGGAEVKAKAVINASGRWSRFSAGQKQAKGARSPAIGLKAHFRAPSLACPPASVDLYFFAGGYCGVQPVRCPPGITGSCFNACAMVRAEVATTLEAVMACHPDLFERSRLWEPLTDLVSTSPLVFKDPQPVARGMLQAGDAAVFVDPFVGDGISLALRSGRMAAECLIPVFRRQLSLDQARVEYSRQYRRHFAPILRVSSKLRSVLDWPRALRRPVLGLVGKSPRIARQLLKITR